MHVGTTVLALTVLVAFAACTGATNLASGDPPSSSTPIASADNGTSVSKVSEALGQRLDGMLSGHPAAP